MKKLLLISATLLLTACNPTKPNISEEPQSQQLVVEEISNLAQDIKQGKSVQCILTHQDTNQTMTYLMKQNKIKITNFINPDPTNQTDNYGSLISDGQYSYMWNDQTKQGIKIPITQPDSADYSKDQAEEVPDLSQEAYQRQYQDLGYTIRCNPQDISDNEFAPPSDVNFTDFSQFLKELPSQMSEEQLEQMQQNLQQFDQ